MKTESLKEVLKKEIQATAGYRNKISSLELDLEKSQREIEELKAELSHEKATTVSLENSLKSLSNKYRNMDKSYIDRISEYTRKAKADETEINRLQKMLENIVVSNIVPNNASQNGSISLDNFRIDKSPSFSEKYEHFGINEAKRSYDIERSQLINEINSLREAFKNTQNELRNAIKLRKTNVNIVSDDETESLEKKLLEIQELNTNLQVCYYS